MTGDQLKAAMHGEVAKLTAEGYLPTLCFVQPETAEKTIEGLLSAVNFDCVLIGAGVRADPKEVRATTDRPHPQRHARMNAPLPPLNHR